MSRHKRPRQLALPLDVRHAKITGKARYHGPCHRLLLPGTSTDHTRSQIVLAAGREIGVKIKVRHIEAGRLLYCPRDIGAENLGTDLEPYQEYLVYYTIIMVVILTPQ